MIADCGHGAEYCHEILEEGKIAKSWRMFDIDKARKYLQKMTMYHSTEKDGMRGRNYPMMMRRHVWPLLTIKK